MLLPTVRDPRLHLAAVIVSLQVLGQTAFGFQLSIAQILVSLLTCAVLEVALVVRRQRVLMWPASALLTGNGVAFVLRVPGTEHGDWWSLRGWWIFAGTAAVALLSKYVIVFRGRHIFNPSNFGLVLCFLLLGPARADPLDLWWGPMSDVDGARARDHRRRRTRHPFAPAAAGDRGLLLDRVRRRCRRARGQRSCNDGALASRPDHRLGVLARPRLLARDSRLPLLHDHRPEDNPGWAQRPSPLRRRNRLARDSLDRARRRPSSRQRSPCCRRSRSPAPHGLRARFSAPRSASGWRPAVAYAVRSRSGGRRASSAWS